MTSQTFTVGGLHCDGCVKSVQSILNAQTGVVAVKVELSTGHTDIETAPGFDAKAAIHAVTKAGFTMSPA